MSFDTQEEQLGFLLSLHEGPVFVLESNEYEFHAAIEGSSAAMIARLHRSGYVTITNRFEPEAQRTYAVAEITDAGRRNMNELIAAGVAASDDPWID